MLLCLVATIVHDCAEEACENSVKVLSLKPNGDVINNCSC
jgi:hypothetical protein